MSEPYFAPGSEAMLALEAMVDRAGLRKRAVRARSGLPDQGRTREPHRSYLQPNRAGVEN